MNVIPNKRSIVGLVKVANEGKLCLPDFQRDFIWPRDLVADLVRSILRRYYLGSLLLLRCERDGLATARGGISPTLATERSGVERANEVRAAQAQRGSLGTPLAGARGGAPECTSDMHYKTDQGHALQRSGTLMTPQLWLYARKCVHALERESDRGSTLAVLVELSKRGDVSFGSLPRIWCFAANWLPMDQSLQRSRTRGPSGFEPQATRLLTRNVRGD